MNSTSRPEARLVAIGLGSNAAPTAGPPFDDPASDTRLAALSGAMVLLARHGIRVVATSRVHETDPIGPVAQAPFLNAAALVETAQDPAAFLSTCEDVERAAGRRSKGDNGPRPLDIDLLAAWNVDALGRASPLPAVRGPRLFLPHPRLAERPFVLVPLVEIAPDLPLLLPGMPHATDARALLAGLRRGVAGLPGVRPGPASASFPQRASGERRDLLSSMDR